MLRQIRSGEMGHSNQHWLDAFYHFSFAQYENPDNVQFGALRVLNDDRVGPGTGFSAHAHENMEVLTYVVDGELTHADNMGNRRTLTRGQVQYMSAGTGVIHSEHNYGHEVLRLLQIWILPDKQNYPPRYGDHPFGWDARVGRWMPIASGDGDERFPIQIHADVHMYAALILRGDSLAFEAATGRQAYLVAIEGSAVVNDILPLDERDALEIAEERITVSAESTAHLLVIEMAKPNP
jgi:redox-sensitive bicupin YhaK (pirin superfamily)